MKNDLTRDEWLVLAEFFSRDNIIINWINEQTIEEKNALLMSARKKVIKVGEELKGS